MHHASYLAKFSLSVWSVAEATSLTKTPETGMLSSHRAESETHPLLQGLTHNTWGI